jgi:putative hydrolase of the HAD superfamily
MTAAPGAAPHGPPEVVTFDFWDTLLRAPSAAEMRTVRAARMAAAFEDQGLDVEREELEAALTDVRRLYDERWAANQQFTGPDAAAVLLERLGIAALGEARERLVDAFVGVDDGRLPPLTDHVAATLRALVGHGVQLGIVCDVGLVPSVALRGYLDRHGVLELFDHWSFSDEVGAYKPDPVIFRHALDGLGGVAPARAAHVGDLRRTDVAGARAFGMISVRYAGSHDDAPSVPGEGDRAMLGASGIEPADRVEADHVITDHDQLLGVLGFG